MNYASRIFTGDCREVLTDIEAESIAACITDPPYNYEFVGHKWDHAEIERRKARVADSKTLVKHVPYGSGLAGGVRNERWYAKNRANIQEYGDWTRQWGSEVFRVCKPGAYVAVFNSTRTAAHVQVALEDVGFYARDILAYRKSSGIPKGFNLSAKLHQRGREDANDWTDWHSALRNEWEAIILVQKPLMNNYMETFDRFGIGVMKAVNSDGSFQSNILEGFARSKSDDFNTHSTVKPLGLMMKLIELLVPQSGANVVLDPFAGSGTTLVAAAALGYPYLGIEVVPEYVQIIEKRLLELPVGGDGEPILSLF